MDKNSLRGICIISHTDYGVCFLLDLWNVQHFCLCYIRVHTIQLHYSGEKSRIGEKSSSQLILSVLIRVGKAMWLVFLGPSENFQTCFFKFDRDLHRWSCQALGSCLFSLFLAAAGEESCVSTFSDVTLVSLVHQTRHCLYSGFLVFLRNFMHIYIIYIYDDAKCIVLWHSLPQQRWTGSSSFISLP